MFTTEYEIVETPNMGMNDNRRYKIRTHIEEHYFLSEEAYSLNDAILLRDDFRKRDGC